MNIHKINIAIFETSVIISEGLSSLLIKSDYNNNIYTVSSLEELKNCCQKKNVDIAIINPTLLINMQNDFLKFKRENSEIFLIGLVNSFYHREMIKYFDNEIYISDSLDNILSKLRLKEDKNKEKDSIQEDLTERETEVLFHLVKGLSNKEIADMLNISIHTVISHRKNINEKTGIKSLPALTIYAISKKIISLDF